MDSVEFWKNSLFVKNTMLIGDLHLGYSNWQGPDFSTGEYTEVINDITELINEKEPDNVVLLGDVFHNFDRPSQEDKAALDDIHDAVRAHGATLQITPGNHDTYKFDEDIFFKGNVNEEISLPDNGVALHGHQKPTKDAKFYVIGHLHPTIDVEGVKHKCLLKGTNTYNGSTVYILPTFSNRPPGTPVLSGSFVDSPLIAEGTKLDEFTVTVWDDSEGTALEFPTIRELKDRTGKYN